MPSNAQNFSPRLLTWFDLHGRKDLPWQQNKTPYRVWVSEIMLQQTQVSSVIGYYQRFMTRFPNLDSLAQASEGEVLEHWAGLGYYARGRNLLKAARILCNEHQGHFPDDQEKIEALPGIGRSTAGAILSIAFKQPATILDGNVKRVLCRHEAISTWPGERKTEQRLWKIAESYSPQQRVDDYSQAIMDLGATLCTRSKPDCERCPLTSTCQAYQQNMQQSLPKSKPKKTLPHKQTRLLHIISSDNLNTSNDCHRVLLEKRPSPGIWGGLHSLPECSATLSMNEVQAYCEQQFDIEILKHSELSSFHHTFSHYKLELRPIQIWARPRSNAVNEASDHYWFGPESVSRLGLPAPIKKYLQKQIVDISE